MAELIKSVKALGEAITGEKIEGDTLFEAVKDAGEKMTGKELEGKELNDIIAETAEEYHGGGGNPCEVVAGKKLTVDLSSEVLDIREEGWAEMANMSDIKIGYYVDEDSEDHYKNMIYDTHYNTYDEHVVRINLFPNEQNNQLLMELIGEGAYYVRLNQPIVVYEGDVTGLGDTSTIQNQLPTVTVTLNENDFHFNNDFYPEGSHKVFVFYPDYAIHVDIE